MYCPACGAAHAADARFCAKCGGRVQPDEAGPAPPASTPRRGALTTRADERALVGLRCAHCGQRTSPVPYFSRGVNIAKLVVLLPFTSVVGPLLLFFLRKDRFVCTWCRAMLPLEAPVGLLDAFSPNVTLLPPEGLGGADGALVPLDAGALVTPEEGREVARLERNRRRNRFRAWAFGVMGAGLFVMGGAALASSAAGEAASFFFGTGTLTAFAAGLTGHLGRKQAEAAASLRRRQRNREILALARARKGRLTVTEVASRLGLELREAEASLDALVDGHRVDIQNDAEGLVTYVFPELQ
jgi:hypothetical protein